MKNPVDYSKYKCPYEYVEKECEHELHGPEGYENIYSVWCDCGFRGPVFYLDPDDLCLERKEDVMRVDLNKCKVGDKLLSCHGMVLVYNGRNRSEPFPHEVVYPNGEKGSRTDDGQAFIDSKQPEDHDIVEIIEELKGESK
jgi:hypothetical protein